MKYTILSLILLFSTSCGKTSESHNETHFSQYELEVASHLGLEPHDLIIPIVFSDELTTQSGLCRLHKSQNIGTIILINPKEWDKLDQDGRLGLIAHEMLHCYSGLNHVHHKELRRGSLMSPYTYDSRSCIKYYGLDLCIRESFKLREMGIIENVFK